MASQRSRSWPTGAVIPLPPNLILATATKLQLHANLVAATGKQQHKSAARLTKADLVRMVWQERVNQEQRYCAEGQEDGSRKRNGLWHYLGYSVATGCVCGSISAPLCSGPGKT